jgi:hypothetical protein
MVIFVPKGDPSDTTILPEEFDATASYLLRCGLTELQSPERGNISLLTKM